MSAAEKIVLIFIGMIGMLGLIVTTVGVWHPSSLEVYIIGGVFWLIWLAASCWPRRPRGEGK